VIFTLFGGVLCSSNDGLTLNYKGDLQPIFDQTNTTFYSYGGLIQPQSRNGSQFTTAQPNLICGNTPSDNAHYMTTQGIPNQIEWYIRTPFANATCIVRISLGFQNLDDSSFTVIVPDNSLDVLADGSFPCGASGPTVESRQFTFDNTISCDHCVLEWIWNTPLGQTRQCADILVTGGTDTPCMGQCQNGGVCSNATCICPPNYTGAYCEGGPGISFGIGWIRVLSIIFWVLLSIIATLALFFCLYYVARKRIHWSQQHQIYHTNQNQQQFVQFDKEGVPNTNQGNVAATLQREV